MPKIVVKRKAEVYKEFPIRPFQNRISIGSEGDNDLIIADKKVSMHHFTIEKEGTNYFIRDNNSAFGTFVNGDKLTERSLLSSGDEIQVGEHSLIFENILFEKNYKTEKHTAKTPVTAEKELIGADGHSGASAPVAETEVPLSEGLTPDQIGDGDKEPDQPIAERTDVLPHYLVAIYGPYTGKKYRLNYDITKIGRDTSLNDIVIRENKKGQIDPSISRRHATIFFENDNFYITDKRSKTRTRVNQRQLSEEDTVQLFPGDEIEIVSDQKSTIFRLVPETKMDYSSPRKAGVWWVRQSQWIQNVAFIAAIILFTFLLIKNWGVLSVINQKPSELTFNETPIISSQDLESILLQPMEVLPLIPSLAPATADFNGDGFVDMVYLDKIGYLKAYDGKTHKPLWQISSLYQTQLPLGIILADLNNNGLKDILIPSNNSIIYAVDGQSGTEIWASPLLGGSFSGNPVIADLNGDNLKDVFICNQNGKVHIGMGSFTSPEWSVIETDNPIKCTPSAGDIDGDGLPEVVFGTENGYVYVYDGTKKDFSNILNINEEFQKAKGSFFEEHPIRQRIALGDLNQDKYTDLIITSEKNHILALEGNQFKRLWFDQFQADPEISSFSPPLLGDLNGNKALDVIVVTNDNKIIAYDGLGKGGGQKKINWGFISENAEQFVSQPALVDINKDGNTDVLIAGYYHGLYLFNGLTGKQITDRTLPIDLTSEIIGTPVVADFNKDKKLDILIRKNNDEFSILTSNSKIQHSSVLWGQLNYDSQQSGCKPLVKVSKTKYYFVILISVIIILALVLTMVLKPMKRRKLFSL